MSHLLAFLAGFSACAALAVYVRAEWAHRDAELQRAWDRERAP